MTNRFHQHTHKRPNYPIVHNKYIITKIFFYLILFTFLRCTDLSCQVSINIHQMSSYTVQITEQRLHKVKLYFM